MPGENIQEEPQKEIDPVIKKDFTTAGERLLEIGNPDSARKCFEKAGLSPEQIAQKEQDWLAEHPETIH